MTGTSLDGIDAVLARLAGTGRALRADVVSFATRPYPPGARGPVEALMNGAAATAAELASLHAMLGRIAAEAVASVAAHVAGGPRALDLVGMHGQTVWHAPTEGATLQLGDASVAAHLLGVPVVGDFRTGDVALGGQGAPLVPYADWALYTDDTEHRVLVNLGGIANITILPAGGGREAVVAFDTGPANVLLDGAARKLSGEPFDRDGRLALSGSVDEALLSTWLAADYFRAAPPKSTGRELFSAAYLEARLVEAKEAGLSAAGTMATLVALTARTVAEAIVREAPPAAHVYVGGGGAHNPAVMRALEARLEMSGSSAVGQGHVVDRFGVLGVDGDAREALAFAVLAHEAMNGVATGMPRVTGASGRAFQGKICHPGSDA